MNKPPMPPMNLEMDDLDPRKLSQAELDNLEHTVAKWRCCVKGCNRYSRVKDFGVWPSVYWRPGHWINVYVQRLFCGRHWKAHQAAETAGGKDPLEYKGDREFLADLMAMKKDLTEQDVNQWYLDWKKRLKNDP